MDWLARQQRAFHALVVTHTKPEGAHLAPRDTVEHHADNTRVYRRDQKIYAEHPSAPPPPPTWTSDVVHRPYIGRHVPPMGDPNLIPTKTPQRNLHPGQVHLQPRDLQATYLQDGYKNATTNPDEINLSRARVDEQYSAYPVHGE